MGDIVKRLSPRKKVKETATWEQRRKQAARIVEISGMGIVDQVRTKIHDKKAEQDRGSETSFEKPEEVVTETRKPVSV